MNPFRGSYYDGRSAARQEVEIRREGDDLHLTGGAVDVRYPLAQVRLSSLPGGLGGTLRFPDGAICQIRQDMDTTALGLDEKRGTRFLARWERSLWLALGALLLTILIVVGLMRYGIPALARQVAFAVPPATDRLIGSETLAVLDRMVFQPSKLTEARRKEITGLFRGMLPDLPDSGGYRLEFRTGEGVGPNAFALPSGVIVITDSLVKLAASDQEIMAVLAHEAGHLRSRHALRYLLQNSVSGLVVAAITGDVLSITSLSATLPTLLIDASYSRDFEREADDSAIRFLDRRRIPRQVYADMLARLQEEYDRHAGGDAGAKRHRTTPADWFSSHPLTDERIRNIRGDH